jgi:hypothetical protein
MGATAGVREVRSKLAGLSGSSASILIVRQLMLAMLGGEVWWWASGAIDCCGGGRPENDTDGALVRLQLGAPGRGVQLPVSTPQAPSVAAAILGRRQTSCNTTAARRRASKGRHSKRIATKPSTSQLARGEDPRRHTCNGGRFGHRHENDNVMDMVVL